MALDLDYKIERHIITGMIVSDDYLRQAYSIWDEGIMVSDLGKLLSKWCISYFEKYNEAPKQNIETLYLEQVKKHNVDKETAADIEDLLIDLSDEYQRNKFNTQYILDKTKEYFLIRNLSRHQEKIDTLLQKGRVKEADELAAKYAPPIEASSNVIDLSNKEQLHSKLKYAFNQKSKPLFTYPGAIGDLFNEFLLRDSFISFLAPEKRGKSTLLLDFALRASKQGCNVVYFQAGDMSEHQQLMRIAINRTRKNNKKKYMGKQWIPVKDCIRNQRGDCDLPEREGIEAVFEDEEIHPNEITKELILQKIKDFPHYKPCSNCLSYRKKNYGSPWLVKKNLGNTLTLQHAEKTLDKFFVETKRRFKLISYPTKTLTVKEIERLCDLWEKEDNFIVDVIVIDYADILISHVKEFRHGQDDIWANLRGLSQKKHALVVTATQADAKSYQVNTLTMNNFTEDKRKIGHVTAMFGINMDAKGREKEIGLARINTIAARDGEFSTLKTVTILQSMGQAVPILTSYYGA